MVLSKAAKKKSDFEQAINYFHSVIEKFPDIRTGSNTLYEIRDAALGAFSLFFTQSPSFLEHQKAMQQNKGKSNAQSLFGVHQIMSATRIRDLLDPVPPDCVFPVFTYIFDTLNQMGRLETFRSYKENFLCALDGVQFFSSNKIHCKQCSQKHQKKGEITYSHSAVSAVIVSPGHDKVISLPPAFITPQDGEEKQDCEINAAKRLIAQYADRYKELGMTILGDDLYCKQPFCQLLLDNHLDFILVCKPESHKTLYEFVQLEEEDIACVKKIRWNGPNMEIDTYRFVNKVPMRDGKTALEVNWCELTTTLKDGTVIYKNSFATNFTITKKNVAKIAADGRARWKIENEGFNILKRKGYNLEHNFGHGEQFLSNLLFTFNLLAYLFHTMLDVMDKKYKLLQDTIKRRETFFNDIRTLTRYLYFQSWEQLMVFMIKGLELNVPDTS